MSDHQKSHEKEIGEGKQGDPDYVIVVAPRRSKRELTEDGRLPGKCEGADKTQQKRQGEQ